MDVSIVLFFAAVVFILHALFKKITCKTVPPGPTGWPIVGCIPHLSNQPYVYFQKLANAYGNIFSLRLGSRFVIVLNDFESAKDAFASDAFMGRPKSMPFDFNKETYETEAFFGMPWKEQRRFSLHMLRDLGLGRSKMEEHIREEILEMLDYIEKTEGQPVPITKFLAPSMSNNMASLVFGKRFKYDDPKRLKMDYWVSEMINASDQVGWYLFFPWLDKILKFLRLGKHKKMVNIFREVKDFIKKEVEEHEKTLDPNNIRDFIDGYLLEIRKEKNSPSFSKPVLEDMVALFFTAGSETVRVSLEWLLLTVSSRIDTQRKIHEEIDEVIGRTRLPEWTDHVKMPYTTAVINEMNRWITIVPLNVLRFTLTSTNLHGHYIPKHAYVIANLWSIHHDTEYWGDDVNEFRPERFLEEDGKSQKKMERLIPFSIGKRACPGEPMAKIEVFLYLVSILQRFDVSLPEGKTANFEAELGATLRPHPQELVFKKRN